MKKNVFPMQAAPLSAIEPLSKASRHVKLVLLGIGSLGAMAMTGCDNADEQRAGYRYMGRQDCVKDWGEDECTQHGTSGGSGGAFIYYRPSYLHHKTPKYHTGVVKGGFGTSATRSASS